MGRHAFPAAPAGAADHRSLEQAADWYVRLHDEAASAADWTQWRAWLDRSPGHQAAWRYIEAVSQRFAPLRTDGEPRAASAGLQAALMPARRRHLRTLAWLSGGVLGSWLAWRHTPLRVELLALAADYRSATGQVREWRLADGSHLWLNTASAADFAIGPAERRLTLLRGEMLVAAAADAARPFVVATPQGRLATPATPRASQPVSTPQGQGAGILSGSSAITGAPDARFSVRLLEQATRLAVLDGAVQVRTADSGERLTVAAGNQVVYTADHIGRPGPADAGAAAWTQGMIVANDMRLDELVAELARYQRGHLGVAPEAAGLRVMGTYPLADPERTLQLLARALSLRVEKKLPWWTTLTPA
ncbi:Protein FecR [Achromobacter deleyi]|uniref:Protein FecR n=1 Tax=Achromobacter deleyi TaxID=1353891 RepID=A0A6S7ASD0_9BURK|nr:FecR domain-containing protein [Achromobacter deleyi]CAB3732793.1 Protein FecR [Achromobacter deleyi]CAB3891415.1 Protein FecR [Achromobacter deleyi]CAB3917833.1 Protein FecR [Achromobacter deleyi]